MEGYQLCLCRKKEHRVSGKNLEEISLSLFFSSESLSKVVKIKTEHKQDCCLFMNNLPCRQNKKRYSLWLYENVPKPNKKNTRFLIRTFCKCKCGMRFLFIFFSLLQRRKHSKQAILVLVTEQIDNSHFFPYVFYIKKIKKRLVRQLFWNAGADEIQEFF